MTKTMKRYGRKEAGMPAPAQPAQGQQPAAPDHATDRALTSEEVTELVGKAVKSAMESSLPAKPAAPDPAPAPTQPAAPIPAPAAVQGVTLEDLKLVLTKSIEGLIPLLPGGKAKQTKDPGDATGRRQIEVPLGWTKGNLPVHGKQLLNRLQGKHQDDGIDETDLRQSVAYSESLLSRRLSGKALTSTGSGTGDELVPMDLSGELQRRLYLTSNLAAFLAPREIDMPTNPFAFPLSTTRPSFFMESTENTAKTESTPGTAQPSLNAVTFAGKVLFSYEIDEDSIVPILPMLQGLLAEAAADALEDALMNGDTTATHQDSDIHAIAKHAAKAWKGFRKLSLAIAELKKDATVGGVNLANVKALLKLMNKYSVNPANVAMVFGPKGLQDLRGMEELITVDKAGPRATLFNGAEVPTLFGCPVITSARCREDTNASGVYDDTTKTMGTFTFFHALSFLLGRRREFLVETFRDIDIQKTVVVASYRKAFTPVEVPSATVTSVATAYNYTA